MYPKVLATRVAPVFVAIAIQSFTPAEAQEIPAEVILQPHTAIHLPSAVPVAAKTRNASLPSPVVSHSLSEAKPAGGNIKVFSSPFNEQTPLMAMTPAIDPSATASRIYDPPAASSASPSPSYPAANPAIAQEPQQTTTTPGKNGAFKEPTLLPPQLPNGSFAQFLKQTYQRNFGMTSYAPPSSPPIPRRALPAPLDPVFPSTEFIGTGNQGAIGSNDACNAQYPLEQWLWKQCPWLAKERIRVYGWLNPGYNYSTSPHSNFPLSYAVASRQLRLDQVVARIERVPDTVQQEHMDWGFRLTNLYGEDYRFTTAKGWLSQQLLSRNRLTGYDPCEAFALLYIPKIGSHKLLDGMIIRVGRYISCPDIEAQLAPDNYLYTHSLMFTVDTYTQTGIQAGLQLNKYWYVMAGFCAGSDEAPWTYSAVPTAQILARYVSKNQKDSIYGGINDINGMRFREYWHPSQGKDNLQQVNVNWTHVFSKRFHTVTEWYYLWTWDALRGGTVSNGPVRKFGGGGGPGAFLPGLSTAIGVVNYSLYKVSDKDYICIRPIDLLDDPKGWRTGTKAWYTSYTIGWCHHFSDLLCVRPEIRLEDAHGSTHPYNNGTKKQQLGFYCDLIQRF